MVRIDKICPMNSHHCLSTEALNRGPVGFSVTDCVQNWLDGGGTKDKINIGLSFYGRSVAGATAMNQPHQGADKAKWSVDDGTPQYFNIVQRLPEMIQVRDELTKTPWAYFPSQSECVSCFCFLYCDLTSRLSWGPGLV